MSYRWKLIIFQRSTLVIFTSILNVITLDWFLWRICDLHVSWKRFVNGNLHGYVFVDNRPISTQFLKCWRNQFLAVSVHLVPSMSQMSGKLLCILRYIKFLMMRFQRKLIESLLWLELGSYSWFFIVTMNTSYGAVDLLESKLTSLYFESA